MRLLVIGVGDCGSRIAGQFSELNKKAKSERKVQIINGAYAVNNDKAELTSLTRMEFRDMQAIFVKHTFGEKEVSAAAGAELMKEEGGRVMTAINPNDFYDTDAVMFVAAAAGKFGSGGIPILVQMLKDRHIGKPIYAMVVLPFEAETSNQNVIYNTAICLKSCQQIADAVFLVDNEKFRLQESLSSDSDRSEINKMVVMSFYDLLCSSEPVDIRSRGARTLGIGDMLQTVSGYTAIGIGKTDFSVTKTLWRPGTQNFQEKGSETQKAQEALNFALGRLSIDFKFPDAHKALYLLSIPAGGANVDMVKVLGNHLRELTNNAEIRGGDFYGVKDCAQVTLIVSGLNYIENVKKFFDRAVNVGKPSS
jgi:tubulin-like protein CetZ